MKRRRKKRDMIFPDLTPLIDVVFLLLIFFMVVTSFDRYSGLNITLPKAGITAEKEDNNYELIIDRDGKYYLKENEKREEVTLEEIGEKIQGVKAIAVTADKDLKYEVVAKTMGTLKKLGIENMGLNFYE